MDGRGLTLEQLIEKHLRSKLEAKGTKFFPWRKTTGKKTEQIIDWREVAALGIRLAALDIAFKLRGDLRTEETRLRSRRRHSDQGDPRHNA